MGRKLKLTATEITDQIGSEIDDARDWYDKQRETRMAAMQAYYRQAIGTEEVGRSQAYASDVMEAVEWVMPHVLRQVLSSDDKIKIHGPNDLIAKGLKIYAREQIDDQGGFRFFYDWCKDALIGDNGFVKLWWKRVYSDEVEETILSNVTQDELMQYETSPDYELHDVEVTSYAEAIPTEEAAFQAGMSGAAMPQAQEVPLYGARLVRRELLESVPVYENVPSYEFICAPECRRMNDNVGKGHRRWMLRGELDQLHEQQSTKDEPFFTDLEGIPSRPQGEDGTKEDSEKSEVDAIFSHNPDWNQYRTGEGAKQPVEVIEYYTNLDEDGKLVPSIVWLANGHPIRSEENEEGVNLCTWSPMLNPHHLYGVSYGTLMKDIQNIKTMMIRAMLDSVAYGVDKAWIANSATGVDLAGLQRLRPGKVIIGNKDMVEAIDIQPMDPRLFAVLEYLDVWKEDTSGGFKPAKGQPDSTAKTARGTELLQKASFSRIDLIVLIFAEVGFKDLYQKTISSIQQNLDRPITVMVDGIPVTLTPDNVQGDYKARSSMGIQVDFNEAEYSRLKQILSDVMGLYQMFPFLFPAKKIHNLLRRMFGAAGFKDQDELMDPPPPALEGWFLGIENMTPEMLARPGQGSAAGDTTQNISMDNASGISDEQMAAGSVAQGV